MSYSGPERREMNPEYKEIKCILTDVQLDLRGLSEQVKNLHNDKNNKHKEISEKLEKLDHTIYGNGQLGLISKVEKLKDLPEELKKMRQKVDIWNGVILASVFIFKFLFN